MGNAPQDGVQVIAGKKFRIRTVTNSTDPVTDFVARQLYYNLNGAGWNAVTGVSSVLRAQASSFVSDEQATTNQIVKASTFQAGVCECSDGITSVGSLDSSHQFEDEFCLMIISADVAVGDVIQIKLTNAGTDYFSISGNPNIVVIKRITDCAPYFA